MIKTPAVISSAWHTLCLAICLSLFLVMAACGGGDSEVAETTGDGDIAPASDQEEAVSPPEEIDRDRGVSGQVEDARVAARIKRELMSESSLRTFDFEPDVTDGEVILRGDVRSRSQYDRAQSLAEGVEGVDELLNALTIEGRDVTADDEDGDVGRADSEPAGAEFHTVQSGESLWIIARSYNTSVDRLQSLNNMSNANVRPGDRIRVR